MLQNFFYIITPILGNNRECLSMANFLSQAFQGRLAPTTNIRQGWKGLQRTNTPAYFFGGSMMKKGFVLTTPGHNIIKLFVRNSQTLVIS
jgi:hypothetical protein